MRKALIWCFVYMIIPQGMHAFLVYLRTGLAIGSLGYALYGGLLVLQPYSEYSIRAVLRCGVWIECCFFPVNSLPPSLSQCLDRPSSMRTVACSRAFIPELNNSRIAFKREPYAWLFFPILFRFRGIFRIRRRMDATEPRPAMHIG